MPLPASCSVCLPTGSNREERLTPPPVEAIGGGVRLYLRVRPGLIYGVRSSASVTLV